jgi:hypothetical protein
MLTYPIGDNKVAFQAYSHNNDCYSLCIPQGSANSNFHKAVSRTGNHNEVMSRYKKNELQHQGQINDWLWSNVARDGMKKYGLVLRHEVFVYQFNNDVDELIQAFNNFWAPHDIVFDISTSERILMQPITIVLQEIDDLITVKRNPAYWHLISLEKENEPKVNLAELGLTKTEVLGEFLHACQDIRMKGEMLMLGSGLRSHPFSDSQNVQK